MSDIIPDLKFLKKKESDLLVSLGHMMLGMDEEELGSEYIREADAFITNLDDFLQADIRQLFTLFNSRVLSLILIRRITKFVDMDLEIQKKYFSKWVKSRIPLFRTAASTLRALCGWSYYSLEKSWDEINYPGRTIDREDITPTLLFGKEKWYEGIEVD